MAKIFAKLLSIFGKGQSVILPPKVQEERKKEVKVEIVYLSSGNDLTSIRSKMGDVPLIFLNVSKVRADLKPLVDRLKTIAKQFGYKLYGLDPRWLILTSYEIEKEKNQ